jgi:hypothetical protein
MLGCVAMSVALPYQTTLVGLSSGCLSPGFLSGVGLLEKAGAWKWSCEGLVNEQPPAPACGLEMSFSLGETVKFQLAPGFFRAVQCLASPTGATELSTPTWAFSAPCCTLSPRQREIFLPCIWPPVLSRGHAVGSPAGLQLRVPPKQCVALTWQVGWENGSATGQHRQVADRGFVSLVFGGPSLPRCLQHLSLCSSLCCVIVGDIALRHW